jgi:phospholipid/cholesterol/gamma-HCH transport system substrate-binding protein
MGERVDGRRILPIAGLIAIAAFVAFVVGRGDSSSGHRLSATVTEATNLIKGQELEAGGRVIGVIDAVEPVEGGKRARITMKVEDDAWPLPADSRFSVRWGGTASFYNRHILVTRGSEDAVLDEGATIPAKNFVTPVEVDQLLASFDGEVRTDLKSFINRSGRALATARDPLTRVLDDSPPAIEEVRKAFSDIVADPGALETTLARTDRVVDAIRRADPDLSSLLTGAAGTFDAIADRSRELEATIGALPATLSQVRSTLGKADGTLRGVTRLTRDIGPGVRELRAVADPLDRTLRSLQAVAPDARRTLATVRTDGGAINGLLARTTTLAPQLGSTAEGANENLKCIRPYSPELMGLLMTWGDFMSWNDKNDKILRAQVQNFLPAQYNSVPETPQQVAGRFPGLKYGFPRPPGFLAGQPWLLPECGAGEDALDPSKDQEAKVGTPDPGPAPGGRR